MRQRPNLSPFWMQNHYAVCLAEVQHMRLLHAGGDGMHHLVLANADSSMGVALGVRDELAVKVFVVSTEDDVARLDEVHYPLHVVASHIVGVWIICQNGQEVEGQNLYLAELCQEL